MRIAKCKLASDGICKLASDGICKRSSIKCNYIGIESTCKFSIIVMREEPDLRDAFTPVKRTSNEKACIHQDIALKIRYIEDHHKYSLFMHCKNREVRSLYNVPNDKFLEITGDVCNICLYREMEDED